MLLCECVQLTIPVSTGVRIIRTCFAQCTLYMYLWHLSFSPCHVNSLVFSAHELMHTTIIIITYTQYMYMYNVYTLYVSSTS